ncbi:Transcriptional regulatory protein WalR [subsurface metagenome]
MLANKKKILIVSDDPKLLGVLQGNLPNNCYQVMSSRDSGEELREVLDEVLPDLVILDVLMPRLDGIELCLRIRRWCEVPIIMLSSWGAGKDEVRGLDLGADGYLSEPFNIDDLMVQIDHTIYHN